MRANVCTRRLSFPIIEDLEQSAKGAKRGDKRMRGMADVSKGSVLMRRCTNQWRRVRTQEPNAIKRREVEVEVGRGEWEPMTVMGSGAEAESWPMTTRYRR